MVQLYDLRDNLRDEALTNSGPLHVRAFSAWVLGERQILRKLVAEAISTGEQRHAEHIAVLGYVRAVDLLSVDEAELLHQDTIHLAGRAYFTRGRPWRFEIDGIALLGVALGIAQDCGSPPEWFASLLHRASQEVAADEWNLGLICAAQLITGVSVSVGPPDLAVALAAKGIGSIPAECDAAWSAATSLERPDTADRAAVRLAALQDILGRSSQIVPRTATREDLINVLEGTGRSLKRWPYGDATPQSRPALWEIDNEYNVQDFLWAVLAPLFPDLEDEESLPSLGPKHPRADLGVPSLRTIIEVKYLRRDRQVDRAKLVEQVAADASLYLAKTKDYDSLIAYVWDDAAQSDQHHEIKMGLENIGGIIGVVIVTRPSKMERAPRG